MAAAVCLSALTDDEFGLYDRQIRLWGLDAQNRLNRSHVLLIGLSGLGAEIAKNLVLAGVKEITVMDSVEVSAGDRFSQFLVEIDGIGLNRAEASRRRCAELNSLVNVNVDSGSASEKDENYYRAFDVICMVSQPLKETELVAGICRNLGKKFFCGFVCGYFGYLFQDLIKHEFIEECQSTLPVENLFGPNEGKKSAVLEDKISVKKTDSFVPLDQAFSMEWIAKKNSVKLKQLPKLYFFVQILYKFVDRHGRFPHAESGQADCCSLAELRDEFVDTVGDNVKPAITDDYISFCFGELNPVCAIIGGVMAQEIIKVLSCSEEPINNFFFYDGLDRAGVVLKAPPMLE